jgi:hypothetical protein
VEQTQIAVTARDRFSQTVNEELTGFERREAEFRKAERKERAAQLNLPEERVVPKVIPERNKTLKNPT